MKLLLVLFLAGVVAAQASLLEAGNPCFPDCKWNCDQPSCPAVCEPQCEKPACELRCEKLGETACDIRCEKPKCEVRCSRKNCQSGGCPLCENVCLPAKCQTVCTPAVPNCRPTCSAPKCTWSCRKPTSCPKPKCNLACNARPSGSCAGGAAGGRQCCSCHKFPNMQSAIELASNSHVDQHGSLPADEMMPSLVEVAHGIRLHTQDKVAAGEAEQCCPCSEEDSA